MIASCHKCNFIELQRNSKNYIELVTVILLFYESDIWVTNTFLQLCHNLVLRVKKKKKCKKL